MSAGSVVLGAAFAVAAAYFVFFGAVTILAAVLSIFFGIH